VRGEVKSKIVCNVAVIGAGTMGPGIAQVFAQAGCQVTLIDIDSSILKQAEERIRSSVNSFREAGIYGPRKAKETISRLATTTDLASGLKAADFIVEAIGEDLEIKRALFKKIERLSPAGAIIASNSSTFSPDDMAQGSGRPDKLILTHFVNPPHVVPLIEVARGTHTSDETFEFTLALLKQAGKHPLILKKIVPGHLINNFNFAILSTALGFMGTGIASIEDIDHAFTEALGPRYSVMGPFKTMDLLGLNIIWQAVTSFDANAHKDPRIKEIRDLYQAGKLGMRTGAGFYDYSGKSYNDTLNDFNRRILNTLDAAQQE